VDGVPRVGGLAVLALYGVTIVLVLVPRVGRRRA